MRTVVTIAVGAVLVVGLALGSARAGASVHRANERFCEALRDVSSDIGQGNPDNPGGVSQESARTLVSSYRSAARFAPKKVKKAMKKLAKIYSKIANGGDAEIILTENAAPFVKASAVYAPYYAEQCVSPTIPTS